MVNLATPVLTTDTPQRPVRVPNLSGANIESLMPDDAYYEVVDGEVYRMPNNGMEHGVRGMRLAAPLTMYIYRHNLGEVLHPDTRYVLAEDEEGIRRMRGPDLSFIRRERMPLPPYPPGFVRLIPDLIVEVRSPHDTFSELRRRINDFLEAGTRLAWLVGPLKRTVTVFAPDREPRTLDAAAELDGEGVVPGFRLSVAAIFT